MPPWAPTKRHPPSPGTAGGDGAADFERRERRPGRRTEVVSAPGVRLVTNVSRMSALAVFVVFVHVHAAQTVSVMRPSDDETRFLLSLKAAVGRDDWAWIADRVAYPLAVNPHPSEASPGKAPPAATRVIRSRQEFLMQYRTIFNDRVKKALRAQTPDGLSKSWRGVMVGRGEIWFEEDSGPPTCSGGYCIKAINN